MLPADDARAASVESLLKDRETERRLAVATAEIDALRRRLRETVVEKKRCRTFGAAAKEQHEDAAADLQLDADDSDSDDDSNSDDDSYSYSRGREEKSREDQARDDQVRVYKRSLEALEASLANDDDDANGRALRSHVVTLTARVYEEMGFRGRAERQVARLEEAVRRLGAKAKAGHRRRGALAASLAAHSASVAAWRDVDFRKDEHLAQVRERLAEAERDARAHSARAADAREALDAELEFFRDADTTRRPRWPGGPDGGPDRPGTTTTAASRS
eukprot:CAMPEP_0118909720 /NCGR_PEP_ID=MMETSP1166-20130328/12183_1 /TAXON_ID=1104430 /ORGANISM="Chrysoreinhardia sp, Strain CCMP3193" /LENGTH=274 /DNA_ID=CAMNT_0006849167 /DNA_START=1 /DNA_END=822 /DNA_ORIENTATION=+